MESKHFSASKLHVYIGDPLWREYKVTPLNKAAANVVPLLSRKPNWLGQLSSLGSIDNSINWACVVLSVIGL